MVRARRTFDFSSSQDSGTPLGAVDASAGERQATRPGCYADWMITGPVHSGSITLESLDTRHVTERYVAWMNDPQITRYLESRFAPLSRGELVDYVEQMRSSPDNSFFAILLRDNGMHVGNIKLGPIDRRHLRASIGLIIGEPSAWGKGIATEAIRAISTWAFTELHLEKLTAGAYAANVGSIRAFEKVGFSREGRLIDEVILEDGSRGDVILLGLTRPGFESWRSE